MDIRSLQSVFLTQRVHPFPFRTRKLSSAVATILVWRRTGKIAQRQHLVSDFNAEGPPVPIPNTEVKLCSGDNTCLETDREDSSLLTYVAFRLVCFRSECGDILKNCKQFFAKANAKALPFGTAKGLWLCRNPLKISHSSLAHVGPPPSLSRNTHFIHIPP